MKFSTIFSAAAAMLCAGADAADLAARWNISEDVTFEYDSLSFELGYTVSDYLKITDLTQPKLARVNVFDEGCKEGGNYILGNVTDGISSIVLDASAITSVEPDNTTPNPDYVAQSSDPGSEMDRLITVNITLNSETISENPLLYSEDTNGAQLSAEIRFCVRFGLHTKSTTSVEVNFLETLVTLSVDLTDGFQIGSIAVEPRDRLVRTANQVYNIEAYRCDASNVEITDNAPINQGTVVRVCVMPDGDARGDGIYMRSIDQFDWTRGATTQPAITGPNTAALNELTTLTCSAGVPVCTFETILFAAFYTTAGAVAGSGVASMQFGTNAPPARRALRGDEEERMLQEAAAAEFELDFDVIQATPYGTESGAASFGVLASAVASVVVAAFM